MTLLMAAACQWATSPLNLTSAEVTVEDQHGARVNGARVSFTDWTSSGSTFTVSGATENGVVTFAFRDAGQRRCEIQLPAGYGAGPAGLVQMVDVVVGVTTRVRSAVIRTP